MQPVERQRRCYSLVLQDNRQDTVQLRYIRH